MSDIETRYRKNGAVVCLITVAQKDGYRYILTFDNVKSRTTDNFEIFADAFDSFCNIVKTIEKGIA